MSTSIKLIACFMVVVCSISTLLAAEITPTADKTNAVGELRSALPVPKDADSIYCGTVHCTGIVMNGFYFNGLTLMLIGMVSGFAGEAICFAIVVWMLGRNRLYEYRKIFGNTRKE